MFDYLKVGNDANRLVCQHCFRIRRKFVAVSEDTGIPPGLTMVEGQVLQVSSYIESNCKTNVAVANEILCARCNTMLGRNLVNVGENVEGEGENVEGENVGENEGENVGVTELEIDRVLYYDNTRRIIFGFANNRLRNNRPENFEDFEYLGIDALICRFCIDHEDVDVRMDFLVGNDIPPSYIVPNGELRSGVIVSMPNRHADNVEFLSLDPSNPMNVEEGNVQTYAIIVCRNCGNTLGYLDRFRRLPNGGGLIFRFLYRYTFNAVLHRSFGSRLQLPENTMYMPGFYF